MATYYVCVCVCMWVDTNLKGVNFGHCCNACLSLQMNIFHHRKTVANHINGTCENHGLSEIYYIFMLAQLRCHFDLYMIVAI